MLCVLKSISFCVLVLRVVQIIKEISVHQIILFSVVKVQVEGYFVGLILHLTPHQEGNQQYQHQGNGQGSQDKSSGHSHLLQSNVRGRIVNQCFTTSET